MTEQDKQPPAEAEEGAVAWVWEWYGSRYDDAECWNTTIEASKPADWELNNSEFPIRNLRPLYTSQTTATQAAVAAAMRNALDSFAYILDNPQVFVEAKDWVTLAKDRVANSIPAEATAALEKICMEVAEEVHLNCVEADWDWQNAKDLDEIVRDVLNNHTIVTPVIEKGK